MINEKQEDRPLIYDFSKPLHVKYLNETINRITQYIFHSKVYSSYTKYSSKNINKTDKNNFDIMNDDWNFCILICKFIDHREPLSNVVFILERFLYNHRYQKLTLDHRYINMR